MATEEVKKTRQLKLCNDILFGFAKGMYDLFGDSALATVEEIGESIIEEMEHEMGLEIHGEDPRMILAEIGRLLIDEFGMCQGGNLAFQDGQMLVTIEGCMFWHSTSELRKEGIPPYTCVPMMIAKAALHKRLGQKAHLVGVKHDDEKHRCDIDLRLA